LTALLAHQAQRVTSVEIDAALAEAARAQLAAHSITGAHVETGDGARGWRPGQLFDVIVLTGSTPVLPRTLTEQLKPGGRLFAVVGAEPAMHARLVTMGETGQSTTKDLFETVLAPLVNALQPERFAF
jgi:protein-L-isoaspartate(D-aspartate) O-methyltransferase